jgi:hypothetical protein
VTHNMVSWALREGYSGSLKRLYILEVQRAEDVENKGGAVDRVRNTEV